MHLSILLMAASIAVAIRLCWFRSPGTWGDRWQRTLEAFLLPPILWLATNIAVLTMGHRGMMLWHPVGWMGCHLALGAIAIAGVFLAYLFGQQWRWGRQVRSLPSLSIAGRRVRVLETSNLFAARVGIWKSESIVSRGLLQSLKAEQIEAVLSHEEAHNYYRDNFFFFWLSWIHQLTFWLPQTEPLWQELLLLREIRADCWASQRVDALTLAEALLLVARSAAATPNRHHGIGLYAPTPAMRLEERINFLLSRSPIDRGRDRFWIWLLPIALPILTIPLHC
jgi:Zn-dependent protease with chaperone function